MQWLLKWRSFLQKAGLGLLTLGVVAFFYTGQEIFYYMKFGNDFKCHQLEEKDALPLAADFNFSPEPNSIFFHETSCRGSLRGRQACAIESAARMHPNKQIYVLFSSPVSDNTLRNSSLAKLSMYLNINFARVHIAEYARNTPLEDLVASKEFYRSKWWVEHTSDVLRSLTLYKWGGVYLDMDMLVVKSLASLGKNWVAKEQPLLVNGAAIAISKDRVGRKLINAIVE
ncbi:unnamed protein product [Arctia plantaginis]|uniref:Alpha-1,4-N-acetylglucosaminyltransferase n=1 Tax=Arctia plantaginis TaxID=874455 RepID=A0A8S1AWG7_ARCPL|nr:unnamed protein product [Arctia plantaginis]